jgi:hypothetical protein
MVEHFPIRDLRNAEHYQFMASANRTFDKYGIENDNLKPHYLQFGELLQIANGALQVEKKVEKIREKNEADRRRDRLHGKFSIT